MSQFILYIIVFIISAIPFMESTLIIPIGILTGLNPIIVTSIAIIGNLLTFSLAMSLEDKVVTWMNRRKKITKRNQKKKQNKEQKKKKAVKLWDKYGMPGLAAIHPVTIGSSHATALIALSLSAKKKNTFFWIAGSILIWAIAFALLSYFGSEFIRSFVDLDGWLS